MRALDSLSWELADGGAIVRAVVSGERYAVFVPLHRIKLEFAKELDRVDVSMGPAVGAPSVGGLFSSLKKAYKSATRSIKRVLPKAVRRSIGRVEKIANKVARKTHQIATTAARAGKAVITSPYFRAGMAAAAFAVPALAPGVLALEAANQYVKRAETVANAVKKLDRGIGTAIDLATKRQGDQLKKGFGAILQRASGGDKKAQQFVGAMRAIQAKAQSGPGGRQVRQALTQAAGQARRAMPAANAARQAAARRAAAARSPWSNIRRSQTVRRAPPRRPFRPSPMRAFGIANRISRGAMPSFRSLHRGW